MVAAEKRLEDVSSALSDVTIKIQSTIRTARGMSILVRKLNNY